ncbi:winged helix-turn-helix domain-containing protein [Nodosilinea sp. LEGE 06152]|nr:winged helix-turn-helix domain-containing protein [Nodosilinea sp. LEGE 06152]
MKRSSSPVPTFDSMLLPTIQALQVLGGSGTIEEIYEKVVELLGISDKVLEITHGNTSQSEVEYRLAWSRTYLGKHGLLPNRFNRWRAVGPRIERVRAWGKNNNDRVS